MLGPDQNFPFKNVNGSFTRLLNLHHNDNQIINFELTGGECVVYMWLEIEGTL